MLHYDYFLSPVAKNNLITMGIASEVDVRQIIPTEPCIPNAQVRLLRAKLIIEEARETCEALGFLPGIEPSEVWEECDPNLEQIIDGCIDTNYVCIGTLMACGVPDLPHAEEVNRANLDKFPNGIATCNENGKFTKPIGWKAPDHNEAGCSYDSQSCNLKKISEELVKDLRSKKND